MIVWHGEQHGSFFKSGLYVYAQEAKETRSFFEYFFSMDGDNFHIVCIIDELGKDDIFSCNDEIHQYQSSIDEHGQLFSYREFFIYII